MVYTRRQSRKAAEEATRNDDQTHSDGKQAPSSRASVPSKDEILMIVLPRPPATEPSISQAFLNAMSEDDAGQSSLPGNPIDPPQRLLSSFSTLPNLNLSPEAQEMLAESQTSAKLLLSKMKSESNLLAAYSSSTGTSNLGTPGRKLSKPRSRFSDAHKASFERMDSIANHPSAWRANRNHKPASNHASQPSVIVGSIHVKGTTQTISKTMSPLKRTLSKTSLKTNSPSIHGYEDDSSRGPIPNAKRVKHTTSDDAGTYRSAFLDDEKTPSRIAKPVIKTVNGPSTPTRSSIIKSRSVRNLRLSPLKNKTPVIPRADTRSDLLAGFGGADAGRFGFVPPALSPTKSQNEQEASESKKQESVSITSSPGRVLHDAHAVYKMHEDNLKCHQSVSTRLNTPSPTKPLTGLTTPGKTSYAIANKTNTAQEIPSTPKHPSISRPVPKHESAIPAPPTPSPQKHLKSILRTPQRLYSNDPEKIAAGTHLASPSQVQLHQIQVSMPGAFPTHMPSATAPPAAEKIIKHVDFSASARLKAFRDEVKAASAEPEPTYPDLAAFLNQGSKNTASDGLRNSCTRRMTFAAPTVSSHGSMSSPITKEHLANAKFTFRAGVGHDVKFPTIRAVRTSDDAKTPVSAQPPRYVPKASSSKKRKAEDDLDQLEIEYAHSEKENDEHGAVDIRSVKKARVMAPIGSFSGASLQSKSSIARVTTVCGNSPKPTERRIARHQLAGGRRPIKGLVKRAVASPANASVPIVPKKAESSAVTAGKGGMSKSRLEWLAMPKKR